MRSGPIPIARLQDQDGEDAMRKNPNMTRAALAAGCALALAACGGGGGGGLISSSPPPPPVIDQSPMIVTSDLVVQSTQSIGRPVVLENGAALDNQGGIGAVAIHVAVEAKAASVIRNHGSAIIRGADTAVRMDNGGELHNGAGSTIEATGSDGSDCGAGVRCAIHVVQGDFAMENAGSIIGSVRMDQTAANEVTLVAGGSINGNLEIGPGAGSSLSLAGGVGTTQRYSQAVTGDTVFTGALSKSGDGAWIIDGDWGHPGSIEIDGGRLEIADGGPSAFVDPYDAENPFRIYLRHGELVFNRSDDVFIPRGVFLTDTSIGEDGVLVQAGTGKLTLNDWSVMPATIRIERGTLQYGDGGDFVTEIVEPHTDVENDGALVFDSNLNVNWYGTISGAGSVTLNGVGDVYLPDVSTYTGGTTVNNGYLWSDQILPGNVVVNAGGYVQSLGIAGNLSSAGTVDARGQGRNWGEFDGFSVGGDYHQSATGTLLVNLGRALEVAGTATLDGGTLKVNGAANGYVANTHTEVLVAAGGVTGTFDQLVKKAGVVFTSSTIHYEANSVWLDTTGLNVTIAAAGDGIGYTSASMNSAQRVQGSFEQLNDRIATDSLAGVSGDFLHAAGQFQRAPSIEAAQASLRSLSGELHAASAAMTFRAIDAGNEALSDHLDGLREGRARFGMWTQQLDSSGGMARSGFDGVGFQLDGWLVGNDYRIGRSGVAGFAFGQGMGRQQLQNGADRDDSRRTEGMFYAGLSGDRWYAQGRLGFGHVRQDIDRRLLLGDTAEGVWTRYDGRYQMAYGETGLRFDAGALRVTPFMSVEYARSDRDGFAEEGAGGFGLRSDAQAVTRTQASVGLRAARRWNFGGGRTLDFGAHAQWNRTLGMSGDAMDASFVGLPQWSPLLGIGLSRYGSLFGVGLNARLSPNASLRLAYDYESGRYDSALGVTMGFNMAF
jgi:fibronectin-binding autotransporter adhesin